MRTLTLGIILLVAIACFNSAAVLALGILISATLVGALFLPLLWYGAEPSDPDTEASTPPTEGRQPRPKEAASSEDLSPTA